MAEHITIARNDGWRDAGGGLRVRGLKASHLVVSVNGGLRVGVLEPGASLGLGTPALRAHSPGLFGSLPTIGSNIPGGELVPVAFGRGGPYHHRYENSYVRVDVTTRTFLPTLLIGFKPYALLTLGPDGLEAVRGAASRYFLAEELDVKISRFGVAVDLLGIGFVPPGVSELVTRARRVEYPDDPCQASPTFGSPSGGLTFAVYDHTALRLPEEDWLSDRPRPRHDPPKGLRVWRTEVTFHRPAIRKLGLDKGGVRRASVVETIPDLADHTTELVSATLGGEPWVTVIHNPSDSVSPALPEAPWWGPVREAFLEGGSVGIAVPSMLSTSGGNGKPGRSPLGRLATLLSLNRR